MREVPLDKKPDNCKQMVPAVLALTTIIVDFQREAKLKSIGFPF